jgi:excisionase family DNA binding protein
MEELYTVHEISKATRMSDAWVRQKMYRKEIRYIRLGRRVFITKKTLEELLAHSVIEPKQH